MQKRDWAAIVSAVGAGLLAVILTWALTSNYHHEAPTLEAAPFAVAQSPPVATGTQEFTVLQNSLVAAWAQAAIAVLGLVGLALTVWFARHAWKTARETGKAQTRAYLSFQPSSVSLATNGGVTFTNSLGIVVSGDLVNTGQSPAHRFWIEFQFVQLGFADGPVPPSLVSLERFPTVTGEIGGGVQRPQTIQAAMSIDLVPLISGADEIRALVRVHYLDVFGDPQVSELDAWIRGVGPRCLFYNQHGHVNGAPDLTFEWARGG